MSTIEDFSPHSGNPFDEWEKQFGSPDASSPDFDLDPQQHDTDPLFKLLTHAEGQISNLIDFATKHESHESDVTRGITFTHTVDEHGAQTVEYHRLNMFGDPEAYRLEKDCIGNYKVTHTQEVPVDDAPGEFIHATLERRTLLFATVRATSVRGHKPNGKFVATSQEKETTYDSMSPNGVKELQAELSALQQRVDNVYSQPTDDKHSTIYPAPRTSVEKPVKEGRLMRWLGHVVFGKDDI